MPSFIANNGPCYRFLILHSPFTILRPFEKTLSVTVCTKEDDITTDGQLRERIGVEKSASLWQVHGNRTIVVREPTERTEKADGLMTDQRDLLLAIRAADCQLILVYAPERNVVGLLHVGWRGLIAETIPAFFAKLHEEWNIHPQETLIGIGPSFCQCCAEYGEPDHPLRQFPKRFWDRNQVDLAGIADWQLTECGVLLKNIERHPDCTCCHPEKYWTYRGGDKEKVLQGYTNVLAVQLIK